MEKEIISIKIKIIIIIFLPIISNKQISFDITFYQALNKILKRNNNINF